MSPSKRSRATGRTAPRPASPAQPAASERVPLAGWIFAAVAALLTAWRMSTLIPLFWAQDDAYISFRFARNLVRGHGLVFNVGERVEGYTNFLWTVISAIPMALGHSDPIHAMQWLGFVLLVAGYVAILGFGLWLARRGLIAAPLAVLPLLFVWSFNAWYLSGMETGMVAFFAIIGTILVALPPARHRWAPAAASTAGILAALTRADAITIWFALAVTGLAFEWAGSRGSRNRLAGLRPAAIAWLAPLAIVYLPYMIWRVAYYGSFYPNTYYAKAIYLPAWSRGFEYLRTFFEVYPLAPLILIPVAAALTRDALAKRFLAAVSAVTVVVLLYVARIGGDFMEWRFLVPVLGLGVPGIVVAVAVLAGRLFPGRSPLARIAPAGLTAIVALTLAFVLQLRVPAAMQTRMEGQEVIGELARYCDDRQFNFRGVATRLDELLPKDSKMALTAAGIIPFYCDRPVLDLHGLTDREIARQPVEATSRGRMGHEHFLRDLNEMRRRGATTLLVFEDPRSEPEAATMKIEGGMALVSARIDDGRWSSFFVLDTTRVALAPLRADSGVVVSAGGDPPHAALPAPAE